MVKHFTQTTQLNSEVLMGTLSISRPNTSLFFPNATEERTTIPLKSPYNPYHFKPAMWEWKTQIPAQSLVHTISGPRWLPKASLDLAECSSMLEKFFHNPSFWRETYAKPGHQRVRDIPQSRSPRITEVKSTSLWKESWWLFSNKKHNSQSNETEGNFKAWGDKRWPGWEFKLENMVTSGACMTNLSVIKRLHGANMSLGKVDSSGEVKLNLNMEFTLNAPFSSRIKFKI